MNESLTAYRIGKYGLELEQYDKLDPKGQLLVWEPPLASQDYSVGVDPTLGILGWSRATRTEEDWKHDNAAVEVFRVGGFDLKTGHKLPDVQVAEWAGPLDAQDLAYVCNFIGRLYGGSHEDQQAMMTIEVYPGPGWMTQREMHDKFGYERFLPWLKEGRYLTQYDTGNRGWQSSQHTRRDLWTRSGGHIKRRRVELRSKWLVEELVACKPDNFLAITARAARMGRSGLNDDRVVAAMLALWAANEWQIGQEPSEPTGPAQNVEQPDWQLSGSVSYEDMIASWNSRVLDLQD